VDTAEVLGGEDLAVNLWRVEQLTRLGLDADTADLIANSDADWHLVGRMLAAGCPIPTVVRIIS
jgi:hypothetical protein